MSTCRTTNKRRYPSQALAVNRAAALLARTVDVGHRPLGVYRCDSCEDWHIGHRPLVLPRPRVHVAAIEQPKLIEDGPTPLRCACNCSKVATESVLTARGVTLPACGRHAKRIRDSYIHRS